MSFQIKLDRAQFASAMRFCVKYGAAIAGPLGVSAAHFAISVVLARALPPAEFGIFAYVLLIVNFTFGLSNALLGTSMTVKANRLSDTEFDEIRTYLSANLLFSAIAGVVVAGASAASGNAPLESTLFGAYGALMTLRWFARSYAYATFTPLRVPSSDIVYSALLLISLAITHFAGFSFSVVGCLTSLTGSAFVALLVFGPGYLRQQFWDAWTGPLRAYAGIWREFARWSLIAVVSTEAVANAHAYIVTMIAGPAAFATLAVGALIMRPVGICITALTQVERPILARYIVAENYAEAYKVIRIFRLVICLIWLGNMAVTVIVFEWFSSYVLNGKYDERSVIIATGIWGLVMLSRAIRAPESTLMQATGEFKPLAAASLRAAPVSLVVVLVLLLTFGPVASLLGLLAGDIAMAINIWLVSRRWRLRNA